MVDNNKIEATLNDKIAREYANQAILKIVFILPYTSGTLNLVLIKLIKFYRKQARS